MRETNRKLTVEFLREHDRDRYLSSLVLSGNARDAVTALLAFNADVAAIRSRVSEPAPGEIRLQWWNDALAGSGHGAVHSNPVADCLLATLDEFSIPVGTLQRLLGARRFDLYDDPMPDLESFEGYAGETASSLYQISAMILNQGNVVEAGDAAGHLGVAHAMIGHLRAFGLNASVGRIFLPWSIFAANGVKEAEMFSGTTSDGVVESLGQITELAASHLDKASAAIAQLPKQLRPAFAAIAMLRAQHRQLDQMLEPYAAPVDMADWRKILAMTIWTWRSR
ncbi:phytoene/squalene synthase family protein [Devosia rhodophyticola]|uniref:Phytoene/squalene synthase family protein n=1 Tax=Devosia rhodophyticola TaxID=3026423 RepID=A0ABY7YWM7_9HYPH|nr:phytoene/squalene synthase family protein [Devosia rhodophyticola]WDR05766.1 phytoene/squalene synthase family protein [Devosia rhodophyticola]